jgi:hypothetical protein
MVYEVTVNSKAEALETAARLRAAIRAIQEKA